MKKERENVTCMNPLKSNVPKKNLVAPAKKPGRPIIITKGAAAQPRSNNTYIYVAHLASSRALY